MGIRSFIGEGLFRPSIFGEKKFDALTKYAKGRLELETPNSDALWRQLSSADDCINSRLQQNRS